MKRALLVAVGLTALSAAAADAQLTNFPVYALPSAGDAPATFVGGGLGRGLTEDYGKFNAFGVMVGRTGLGGSITAAVGAGMVNYDPDAKYTFGIAGAVDVMPLGANGQLAVQTGIGYISLGTDFWSMNFPIGVALKTNVAAGSGTLSPWVMPRVHLSRTSFGGVSSTETDFGASGGASFNTAGGFGLHAAIDLIAVDPSALTFGVGLHYMVQ
jgi:hypothetical protein